MEEGYKLITPEQFKLHPEGHNNEHMDETLDRLTKGRTYQDLSTIWITPTPSCLSPKVVQYWMAVMRPMNQPFIGPVFFEGDEVGVAYEKAFNMILESPELSKWKYILTVEHDNTPPQDGILKLYESIEKGYDVVSGLYFTKSSSESDNLSQPMIYGNPYVFPKNFVPQKPIPNALQPCNGLGMGFNLWKIESLKKKLKDMPHPWFKTLQEAGKGGATQDLYFYSEAAKYGLKIACDTRIKVGHMDLKTGKIW